MVKRNCIAFRIIHYDCADGYLNGHFPVDVIRIADAFRQRHGSLYGKGLFLLHGRVIASLC